MLTRNHQESAALRFLYHTAPGRLLLRPLCSRGLSRLCGRFLDAKASRLLVGPFVRRHNIDLSEYQQREFKSFNDFFTREIRPELRPIDRDPSALVAPCDGLLRVYPIRDGTLIPVKQSAYTVSSLLGGDSLADRYRGGLCLVFRLCVDHYHRYCWPDGGTRGESTFLPGVLHTVRPIALERYPVFVQNCREYTPLATDHFGTVTQVEVGAMLVGKIWNRPGSGRVERGEEKGMFLYGGSTIALLVEEGRLELSADIAAAQGEEVPVKMGQRLGCAGEGPPAPSQSG